MLASYDGNVQRVKELLTAKINVNCRQQVCTCIYIHVCVFATHTAHIIVILLLVCNFMCSSPIHGAECH